MNQIHKYEKKHYTDANGKTFYEIVFYTTIIEYPRHFINYGTNEKKSEYEWAKIEAIFANCSLRGQKSVIFSVENMEFDFFISHSSEDKDEMVRPLAISLKELGYQVWYDEFTLSIGDSLRRSIDHGLSKSSYGIVVLSKSFFSKPWPQYELDGLVTEDLSRGKVILPIWHGVDRNEVAKYSPSLADKVAFSTRSMTIPLMAKQLSQLVEKNN